MLRFIAKKPRTNTVWTFTIKSDSRKNQFSTRPIRPKGIAMERAGVIHNNQRFITHTTLPPSLSALKSLNSWQKFVLISGFLALVASFYYSGHTSAVFLIGLISLLYFIDVLYNFFLILKSLSSSPEIKSTPEEIANLKDPDLPYYSILCPLYKESEVLPQFLKAISKLDWPKDKLDAMLLLEENDTETIQAARSRKLPPYVRILIVPDSQPKTKPKACNYGLNYAKGEYIVIYDAEDKPEPLQLKKAYLGFQKVSEDVFCLQAKLNYYNPKTNLLTQLFTAEYSLWFDLILPGMQAIETLIPLGGTSNHFRTQNLLQLQGWDPFNVTEDFDLGARLFKRGYRTAIIDSITLEEANSELKNWIRQRSRWIKGYLQTYLVHMRNPIEFFRHKGLHALNFTLIGSRLIFTLVNPLLWLMTFSYFALHSLVGPAIESLYPPLIFYIASFSLVFGNFLYIYYYMIGCAKHGHYGTIKYVFLIPFYWLLMSIASIKAFHQLIVIPHFWEKTKHGLHLKPAPSSAPAAPATVGLNLPLGTVAIMLYQNLIKLPANTVKYLLVSLFYNFSYFFMLFRPLKLGKPSAPRGSRILIFNWRDVRHSWAGGAETYLHQLARRWVQAGHSVTLFTSHDHKTRLQDTIAGVRIIRRGGFFSVYLFAPLYYLLKLHPHTDIIIDSENGVPFFTPLFSPKPLALLIYHIHQQVFRKNLPFPFSAIAMFAESTLTRWAYSKPQIITISESSKQDIINLNLTPENNINIIHPGTDLKPTGAQKTAFPSFVYLGRLKQYKNISTVIHAFSQLHKRHQSAKLYIAGDGDYEKELKSLTHRLKLNNAVTFFGRVTERKKLSLLSRSWVALQPSFFEGWGMTVIEANACGTPVIAADSPGLNNSVLNGQTGILVPPTSINGFARAMSRLINDPQLRSSLSNAAQLWSQNFSWDRSALEFERLLLNEIAATGSLQFPETSLLSNENTALAND